MTAAATAGYSREDMDRIASMRERLAKTTPGPWERDETRDGWNIIRRGRRDDIVIATGRAVEGDRDFIAHAPDDMAWLLAHVPTPTVSPAVAAAKGGGGASAEPGGAAPSGGATALDSREAENALRGQEMNAYRAAHCFVRPLDAHGCCGLCHQPIDKHSDDRCVLRISLRDQRDEAQAALAEAVAEIERWKANLPICTEHQREIAFCGTCLADHEHRANRALHEALNAVAPASPVSGAPESSEGGGGGAPAAGEREGQCSAEIELPDDRTFFCVMADGHESIHTFRMNSEGVTRLAAALRAPAPPTPQESAQPRVGIRARLRRQQVQPEGGGAA